MKKRVFVILLGIVFLSFLFYYQEVNAIKKVDDSWNSYSSNIYKISLRYPSNWRINPKYSNRYEGSDGFFQVGAILGDATSIDKVAEYEINSNLKPYGTSPRISKLSIDGQEARLISPSNDQSQLMNRQSELIIRYPTEIKIHDNKYNYFVLWSDKEHIVEIGNTIKFVYRYGQ
ncbi:hypothetical protein CPJCM30710_22260 [Clostridium polyendosporum]|uniref:Uncharacterized protein n=1 Tax=Clostridium polyendosporum TaxID=69208 RepID=A0A919S1N9_9CLOT|nr:peptidase M56 [Clostridium polyendosporum]GIM29560.1 hypothetical protein CPJCM30710_22260 [Clostridium polyendosporum]